MKFDFFKNLRFFYYLQSSKLFCLHKPFLTNILSLCEKIVMLNRRKRDISGMLYHQLLIFHQNVIGKYFVVWKNCTPENFSGMIFREWISLSKINLVKRFFINLFSAVKQFFKKVNWSIVVSKFVHWKE